MLDVPSVEETLLVLDFDCEARPLSWIGQDYVTKEPTAIAAKFIGRKGAPRVKALGEVSMEEMLTWFVGLYDEADMVTGHFIRAFDLPLLNGALEEYGLPALTEKLTQDTKADLLRRHGMSNSQESLGAELGLKHPKVQMTQDDWRRANRLTPDGIRRTKKRAAGDVAQHIELRAELLKRKRLGAPVLWKPTVYGSARYHK